MLAILRVFPAFIAGALSVLTETSSGAYLWESFLIFQWKHLLCPPVLCKRCWRLCFTLFCFAILSSLLADPMSPINPDHSELGGTMSPMTTPPATPLSVNDELCQQMNARKRTISSSRWHLRDKLERASSDKDREERCTTPEFEDEVCISFSCSKTWKTLLRGRKAS